MTKIELILDGNGKVLAFVNGKPEEEFYYNGYGWDLPDELEKFLIGVFYRGDDG